MSCQILYNLPPQKHLNVEIYTQSFMSSRGMLLDKLSLTWNIVFANGSTDASAHSILHKYFSLHTYIEQLTWYQTDFTWNTPAFHVVFQFMYGMYLLLTVSLPGELSVQCQTQ